MTQRFRSHPQIKAPASGPSPPGNQAQQTLRLPLEPRIHPPIQKHLRRDEEKSVAHPVQRDSTDVPADRTTSPRVSTHAETQH